MQNIQNNPNIQEKQNITLQPTSIFSNVHSINKTSVPFYRLN